METSHVIRGEEWLPSCLTRFMYRAFGWDAWICTTINFETSWKRKVIKRDGDKWFPVFPLNGKLKKIFHPAIEKGFFLKPLLWPYGLEWRNGQRVVYFERVVEAFDLNRVHKAGAKFDQNRWFNHQHLIKQRRRFVPSLYRCFKGITVPENVLIKLFP
jgi:glutamyl-tRNA synthetase